MFTLRTKSLDENQSISFKLANERKKYTENKYCFSDFGKIMSHRNAKHI